MFHQALGFFQHHFGHLHMARRRFVKGAGYNLTTHGAGHIRHFFGPFVNQQHHQEDFGIIRRDGFGDILQHHGFTRARRRHNQGALAHPDRRNQINDAMGIILGRPLGDAFNLRIFHLEATVRIKRRQVIEIDPVAQAFRIFEIDRIDLEQREITLPIFRRADLAFHRIAGAQAEAAHLGGGDINIIGPGQKIRLRAAQIAKAIGKDFKRPFPEDRLIIIGEGLQDRKHHILLAQ